MNLYHLTIAIIALAVAQTLTIILTLWREGEVKQLRELVGEQRILIAEIIASMRANAQRAQPRRTKRDREPMRLQKPPEPEIKPRDLPDPVPPRTLKDESEEDATRRLTNATNRAREIVAALQGKPPDKIG